MIAGGTPPTAAADNFSAAMQQGNVGLSFRYRLEWVEQDGFDKDATASTLRGRLNYRSGAWGGLSAFAEFDYVAVVGADSYDAGGGNTPGRGQYPVVADPKGEDLNQAYLQYQHGDSKFRLGRQRIILDNARFVGNVGWRQNEQTYDAFSFTHAITGAWQFNLAHISNVNRIFGNSVPAGDHEHNTNLVNLGGSISDQAKWVGYWYDIDNEDVPTASNRTWGLRFIGNTGLRTGRLEYTAEFASQTDTGDNPVSYRADYYRVDLTFALDGAGIYGGFESLEGDGDVEGRAFRTPLATLHAFNGWADKFLSTPPAGLEDAFIGVKGKTGAWSWNVLYHDFSAQSGSGSFGSEIDASLSRKIAENYVLLLKLAAFDGDTALYRDTTKAWVQLTADF
jgi:hypothetical protein